MIFRSLMKPVFLLLWCLAAAGAYADASKVVKIGIVAPLTGFSASYGKDEENGARLAFEEANQAGIVIAGQKVRFEVDAQDDAADPKTAVLIAQRFVDEGVSGVIGHHNSGCSIAASSIYQRAGIPQISPGSSSPLYTARGLNTTFRTISNDDQMAVVAANYSVRQLGAKRIAVIDDSTDYGTNLVTEYVKAVQKAGGDIVSWQYTTTRSIDFRAILTTIKGFRPDLIFYVGQDVQAAGLVRQIYQLGIKARFMGEGGFTNENFLRLAGSSAQGMYSWEYGLPLERMPRAAELDRKMKARFGVGIVQYAPLAYDASWALIHAMQKANSTDPKIYTDALRTNTFDGVTGSIGFTRSGDLKNASATLYQEQGGKWAVLAVEHTHSN
ncbi:branched-chain amino acid ABC transporter substrate-binding protein [Paraburkholderia sp. Tr-20389]|uniref:branched-chain amino acid ABC transporter substrate-binding protein n=1 Tax=Paraburkholderia sp. Tr-20389 TaxID=2703903 RepID=UPI0019807B4D|nr:branched-chain amino acid ABC transporter substrate-binding protein [Paraburkholderia sp. Tr-20389]MBN3753731.1 branched-chain amino acid ABC transporter substrate-binding protein [Paraburkholderia sp. Tr-20389]